MNINYLPKLYEKKTLLGIIYHTVRCGETIFHISHLYYNTPIEFGKIVNANLDVLCDSNGTPDMFHLPERLVIP